MLRVFDESPRHPLQNSRLGTRLANRPGLSGDALVHRPARLRKLGAGAKWLLDFAYYGSSFVFGDLGQNNSPRGFYFAFQALPIIIFIAAFFALLYYFGVMQVIVKAAARVMTSLMGASGAESLNVAASIFMGQTEAPLTIRPFLPEVTRSELMTIMTSGMAHVSGSMMGAYMALRNQA